ncbi:serine/tyrosine/threonine adenylyltransferase [Microdochium nivale]|nr:serine/tyrosine/threonine adenylyltransferase [Microdochium nivale]
MLRKTTPATIHRALSRLPTSAALSQHTCLAQMANHISSSAGTGASINDIPKTFNLTSKLPADAKFPTPADSHKTPRDDIGPRQVRDAIFTWVRPQTVESPELLAVSPAAMRDLGIRLGDEKTDDFVQTVAGNKIQGWDEQTHTGGYPWAQCYGGFQFGSWAGQLGDGRAISLFETTRQPAATTEQQQQKGDNGNNIAERAPPAAPVRYELQLKGAGLTPYSRFADGKAVLRSSIREFVVSEYLHALGIPSTRALSLTLLPKVKVRRETLEPGAIVARFAQSWLRIGNFDILRARGDRDLIRKLATYLAEDVLGGWEALPGRLEDPEKAPETAHSAKRGVAQDAVEGPEGVEENRFARLYREVVRRNAVTVAKWQAYGFMNGVLNTDNTSLFGLSIDFGPFAFMDNFDPQYTPNHDDHQLRYSYKNQPTIIWWNLVRLGESLGELLGAGPRIDEETFIKDGVKEEEADGIIKRAEKIIIQAGEEYKAVFLAEYKQSMSARLGLRTSAETDFDELFSELLDSMEALELDFNLFFRRLSSVKLSELETTEARESKADIFLYKDGTNGFGGDAAARKRIGVWLDKWRKRMTEDWGQETAADGEREAAMKRVNPNFVPRGYILDEVIRRVEREEEREVLNRVMAMALHPFEESWSGQTFDEERGGHASDKEEEMRWTSDPPRLARAMQCSCSS